MAGALSLVASSKLLEKVYVTRNARRQRGEDISDVNEGKRIDANTAFQNMVVKRVETLEAQQKELSEKLALEMASNARLTAENEGLVKENQRQAGEIERQRQNIHDLRDSFNGLNLRMVEIKGSLERAEKVNSMLKSELSEVTKEKNGLAEQVEAMRGK